jgi:hypothetical protein
MIGFISDQVGVLNALLVIVVLTALSGLLSPAARELAGRHARNVIDFASPGTTSAAVSLATSELQIITADDLVAEPGNDRS